MNASNAKDYLPLVQALAEGKVIQHSPTGASPWWDDAEDLDFTDSPSNYRIKPEPREVWINRFPNGHDGLTWYESEEAAHRAYSCAGAVQVCYREVIE